ncbi:hypothetical protein CEXT_496861 [Caerostris extrusa]|uniref:Uncharacterized protein n=1 Tax=Caerostris extrusa TaxID=172846 RepID=A0AAV4Y9M1_CAEEX|nr:hypothetical protein CEXT_496861 [Caerostris extrusa]
MDNTQCATDEELKDNSYLLSSTSSSLKSYSKEAATLVDKVHKSSSAAQNVRSSTWEKTSLKVEECSRRIRAICTYTGVPASCFLQRRNLLK